MTSAAILAGGRARRFAGRDKGALLVGERTIRARQLDELARIADDILIVGASASQARAPDGPVPPELSRDRVRTIPDRVAGAGPLGGLDAALAAARHRVLVVVACDMPFVTSALLGHLAALAGAAADAVVPRTDRRHPLCAAYTRACHASVLRLLRAGRFAMKGLLAHVSVRDVPVGELQAFGDPDLLLANVNSAADYERLVPTPAARTR